MGLNMLESLLLNFCYFVDARLLLLYFGLTSREVLDLYDFGNQNREGLDV